VPERKKSRRKPTLEELEELGYKERPCVLYIPEPNADQSLESPIKSSVGDEEAACSERKLMRKAVTTDVEELADFALKRMELMSKLQREKRRENFRMKSQNSRGESRPTSRRNK